MVALRSMFLQVLQLRQLARVSPYDCVSSAGIGTAPSLGNFQTFGHLVEGGGDQRERKKKNGKVEESHNALL